MKYLRRLREGYTVNSVTHKDNEMKIKLTLPWKHQTFVHYYVTSVWPLTSGSEASKCRVEVTLEGPYEILYDIICQKELTTKRSFTVPGESNRTLC